MLDDRHTEGAAFHGIRTCADLVEQDQCRKSERPVHGGDIRHVPRKRAQVGGNRLLVADVRENRSEDWQLRAARGREMQAGLGHQGVKPRSLQRHRLASRVGPGHDQGGGRRDQEQIDRHGLGGDFTRGFDFVGRCAEAGRDRRDEQGMPSRPQLESSVGRECRLDTVDELRKAGLGLQHIELGRGLKRAVEVQRSFSERVGEAEQDSTNFRGFAVLERDNVVVDFDRTQRLQKEARAARRAPVDDARDGRAVLRLDDEHVATAAVGDDLFLKVASGLLSSKVGFERATEPGSLLAQALADRSQFGARMIHDLTGGLDLAANLGHLLLEGAHALGDGTQNRERARGLANGSARMLNRRQEISEPQQL